MVVWCWGGLEYVGLADRGVVWAGVQVFYGFDLAVVGGSQGHGSSERGVYGAPQLSKFAASWPALLLVVVFGGLLDGCQLEMDMALSQRA